MDLSIKLRQGVERAIVSRIVDDLLARGYALSVDYGDGDPDYEVARSRDRSAVLGALFACDEERLFVHREGQERPFAWIFLVYGNDGWDVVSDYTTNLEDDLKGATALADLIEAQGPEVFGAAIAAALA